MTHLHELSKEIYDTNERNGFHEAASIPKEYRPFYWITKLALVDTEIAEAIEEIRKGHAIDEEYLSWPATPASLAVEFSSGAEATEYFRARTPGKPEGAPSELVDAVIRLLDIMMEAGIDVEAVLRTKMDYNKTRELKHGKQF